MAPPATVHRARSTGTLAVEVCRDGRAFAALAADWARLYANCRTVTPFQSHTWLHSWWVSYGTPGRLRVVLVRDGRELVGAAPLMLVRRPLPALVPLGGAISDFGDVLLHDACADRAAAALAEGLAAEARTALVDLREVRPGGAAEQVFACWRGPRLCLPDSLCLELPAVPMTELVGRLPSSRGQRVRSKLRKVDALGIEGRRVRPDEADTAIRTLLDLHQLQWQGRKVTQEHLQARFCEHLTRSVGPMVRAGEAALTEFRLDGTVLAVDLTLLSPRLAGGYLYGAHPDLRELKVDVATMLLDSTTRHAAGSGAVGGVLSLLRGNEPYKHHWRPDTVVNQRFLLARRRTAGLLAAAACAVVARDRARDLRRAWKERGGGRS